MSTNRVHKTLCCFPINEEAASEQQPILTPESVNIEYIPSPNKAVIVVKVTLVILALGSITLLIAPSEECTKSHCGTWLKNLIGKHAADVVFVIGGGTSECFTSMFYAVQSVDKVFETFRDTSLFTKFWKGSGVTALTLSQLGHIFILAATTHSNLRETLISVLGFIPNALFTGINLPKEFPKIKNELSKQIKHLYQSCKECFVELNEVGKRFEHYKLMQDQFNLTLATKWHDLYSNAKELNLDASEERELEFIFEHSNEIPDDSLSDYVVQGFSLLAYMLGLGMSSILGYAQVSNGSRFFRKNLPELASDVLGTVFSLASLYSNIKLVPPCLVNFVKISADLLRARNLESLQYHINPNIIRVGVAIAFLTAPFADAVINTAAENVFDDKDHEVENEVLRYICDVTVTLIRFSGTIHTANIFSHVYSFLKKNKHAQQLQMMEDKVNQQLTMSLQEFIEKVENDFTAEQLQLFGIEPYQSPQPKKEEPETTPSVQDWPASPVRLTPALNINEPDIHIINETSRQRAQSL